MKKFRTVENYWLTATLLSVLLVFSFASQASDDQPFIWPDGKRAAVNLAYDDALNSQLDNAIPALDKYGLKGTFYLTLASDALGGRLDEWRTAAANGHELGNHTLFHQCSASKPGRSEWVKPYLDLDHTSVEELQQHIRLANHFLTAIDGHTERTFTTPCADLLASGEPYTESIKSDFVAIKSVFGGVVQDMKKVDPYAVEVYGPAGDSGEALIALVEQAAEAGTMVNFTFHGIGGDYLDVSSEAHEALLKYLDENRDIYWTDTFINIMRYVRSENSNQANP